MAWIAQFKVETPGVKWEDTPVDDEKACSSSEEANEHALRIANKRQREVRWNWTGTTQGHYIGGIWKLRRRQAMTEAQKIKNAGITIFE
jgi:hypothetical protein